MFPAVKNFLLVYVGKTTLIALLIVGGGVSFFVYKNFLSTPKSTAYTVTKGIFVEDVLASGKVEGVTTASFNFKNQGKVTGVQTKLGDLVLANQELVLQDTSSFDSQLAEMDAGIQLQRARINQLKAGTSQEEIDVASASASSAAVSVTNAETNLSISKQQAIDQIKNAYTIADDVIRNKVDRLFTNPQSSNPKLLASAAADFKLGSDLEFSRVTLEKELKLWGGDIKSLSSDDDLSNQLKNTRTRLGLIKEFLDKCSLFVNNANNTPSTLGQSTWEGLKIDIAAGRTSVNTALSSVTNSQASITQSQSQIDNAKSSLTTSGKQLQQAKAKVRGTDLAVYSAQLEQAVAAKRKVESLRNDLVIKAPFAAVVTDVNAKVGQVVGPGESVVSLMSRDKLQIKVNIVENNIIKIAVGQSAHITFDAISNKEFTGKIISIDPAEKIINGTTYYQTTVELTETVDFLRSGMTANVWILVKEVPDALFVPSSALVKKGGDWYVRVINGTQQAEQKVTIGARDKNGMVQIVSGLQEGDKVVLDDSTSI